MSLQEKIIRLKMDAVIAARHASFWQKAINEHGEDKATQFYTHLGLNHLEKKSFEWEGLTLSREPKEHEKIAVKGIANAQESSKEAIGNILLSLRTELITDGLEGIKKLESTKYHELILDTPAAFRTSLRDRLISTYRQGRFLVAAELGKKEAVPEDEFDDLDELTDLTDSRVANDVQSRIIAAAQRYKLLGLKGPEFINAVQNEITAGSVSYIDRAATGLANKVINIGRMDEAERRKGEWTKITYSSLLDLNTCEPCAAADGDESEDGSDLDPAPNPSCSGGDYCRCFWVYVYDQSLN